jgi:hypothetical protein
LLLLQTESLIKLFAHACKSDHDQRALEVCRMMDDDAIQEPIRRSLRFGRKTF